MSFRWLSWRNWSLGARLLLIATIPVTFLAASFNIYTFISHYNDAMEDLLENGRIVSSALAESCEYSLVSNNYTDFERISLGLIQADPSIYRIDLFDSHKTGLFNAVSSAATVDGPMSFEATVYGRPLAIDTFSEFGAPHVSSTKPTDPTIENRSILGYVRVTMSKTKMNAKQSRRFMVQAGNTIVALLLCLPLAIILTRTLTRPLAICVSALTRIRKGERSISVPITTGGELGELQSTINEMSRDLDVSKQYLEDKIRERTSLLEESRNEAIRANTEKRKLIQKLNTIVEDERKSIATELHDELNSSLIAARLNCERILSLVSKCEPSPVSDEVKEKSREIVEVVKSLYVSSRNIVRNLRPEVIEMLGLNGSIEEIIRQYNQSHRRCQFFFSSEGDFSSLDHGVSIAAYRLTQEALSNAIKHANATEVSVTLKVSATTNQLLISVEDNGVGFDPDEVSQGIGIIGMRERVYSYSGTIDISPRAGGGSVLSIALTT